MARGSWEEEGERARCRRSRRRRRRPPGGRRCTEEGGVQRSLRLEREELQRRKGDEGMTSGSIHP